MQELKNIMRKFGIVGAGGAGFPSYAKLAEGGNLLLINGSECEPLLYTDYMILKRELSTVITGIKAGTWEIYNGNDYIKTVTVADGENILTFTATAGSYTVKIAD